MLVCQTHPCPFKGAHPAEPFIRQDGQSILITGKNRLTKKLFGCHIRERASPLLGSDSVGWWGMQRDSEIAEHGVFGPLQDILWLDIAMDNAFIMGIL